MRTLFLLTALFVAAPAMAQDTCETDPIYTETLDATLETQVQIGEMADKINVMADKINVMADKINAMGLQIGEMSDRIVSVQETSEANTLTLSEILAAMLPSSPW